MGNYTNSLFKKNRVRKSRRHTKTIYTLNPTPGSTEGPIVVGEEVHPRLVACYIKRDNEYHSYGFKSHAAVRRRMGDIDPYISNPADEEGFVTSDGQYLRRRDAMRVGAAAGQCQMMGRELLSSDIKW